LTVDRAVGLPSDRLIVRDLLGWIKMTTPHHFVRVLQADRYNGGILIVFADGTSIVYAPEFLYEHRGAEGNWEVGDDPEAL
jgi:hypothetical protein